MGFKNIRENTLKPFVVKTNPNRITAISLVTGITAGFFFAYNYFLSAIILLILSGLMDLLDGEIAKKLGKETKRGDIADHVADRIVDMSIFIGLAFSSAVRTEIGLITAIAVLMISYLGTQSQAVLGERLYKGVLGRFPRTVAVLVLTALSIFNYRFIYYGMNFILGLAVLTILERLWEIHKKIQ